MKKEKYIYEYKYKGKLKYLTVKIQSKDLSKPFIRNVNISDYPSPQEARIAACAIRDKAIQDIRTGSLIMAAPTVKELYNKKFELFPCALKTRKNHDHFYKFAIEQYANVPIDKITPADIQKSINEYGASHTLNLTSHLLSVWRQIFRAAQMQQVPVSDKTLMVILPKSKKVEKHRDVRISDKDFNTYMDALLEYHDYDDLGRWRSKSIWYMLWIAYYAGMRPAEILALTREDIDLKRGYISVNKAIGSNETETHVVIPTKNEFSIRSIPISDQLKDILVTLMEWNSNEYLICDHDGSIYEIDFLCVYINNVSKSCGIPFNTYRLRHKFSSDLFRQKENPRVVQDLMGHASADMSLEYARSTENDQKKAVNKRSKHKINTKINTKYSHKVNKTA